MKTYADAGGSFTRRVAKPVEASVIISVDGVKAALSDFSVDHATGTVTFRAGKAPPAGAAIRRFRIRRAGAICNRPRRREPYRLRGGPHSLHSIDGNPAMKPIPAALAEHLADEATTTCHCWKVTLKDGEVIGFTDHDGTLSFAGTAYLAASGFGAVTATARPDLARVRAK